MSEKAKEILERALMGRGPGSGTTRERELRQSIREALDALSAPVEARLPWLGSEARAFLSEQEAQKLLARYGGQPPRQYSDDPQEVVDWIRVCYGMPEGDWSQAVLNLKPALPGAQGEAGKCSLCEGTGVHEWEEPGTYAGGEMPCPLCQPTPPEDGLREAVEMMHRVRLGMGRLLRDRMPSDVSDMRAWAEDLDRGIDAALRAEEGGEG